MAKHLSKKELKKPDEFISFFSRLTAQAIESRKRITWISASVLVALIGFLWWQHQQSKLNQKAANEFFSIVSAMPEPYGSAKNQDDIFDVDSLQSQESDAESAPTPEEWKAFDAKLESFLKDYKKSSVGSVALIYQGRTLLALKEYERAANVYAEAASVSHGREKYLAMEGQAKANMQMKKWKEAEAIWEDLSVKKDNPLADFHLWNKGLAQEGDHRNSEALKTYSDFEKRFSDSPLMELVRSRIAYLQQNA